jgi:hypothetical protein
MAPIIADTHLQDLNAAQAAIRAYRNVNVEGMHESRQQKATVDPLLQHRG